MKQISPECCSHHLLTILWWTWPGAWTATHTFKSGKLNEVIEFFVGQHAKPPTRQRKRRIVEVQSPNRSFRRTLLDDPLDPFEDQLPRRAPPARSRLMNSAVQVARQIDGRADWFGFHESEYEEAT